MSKQQSKVDAAMIPRRSGPIFALIQWPIGLAIGG
jgi:hypothetical protein